MPNASDHDLAALALPELPSVAWQRLRGGVARGADPFHTPVLATIGPDGPTQRTVVLRAADEQARRLACHTDRRSPKIAHVGSDSRASWLFYDRKAKLQVRLTGHLSIHTRDTYADERWEAVTGRGRACYRAAAAPGDIVPEPPVTAAPPDDDKATADARNRFAVLACRIDRFEWLFLSGKGHRRAQFVWNGDAWRGDWLAP